MKRETIKELKTSYSYRTKIMGNGTITLPSFLRIRVKRDIGDEVEILVPKEQK
jgi:bifunctional DNA-binding transcriptional regulator/antitoxin component of YhaV-PrlF toxin-antitoxin module